MSKALFNFHRIACILMLLVLAASAYGRKYEFKTVKYSSQISSTSATHKNFRIKDSDFPGIGSGYPTTFDANWKDTRNISDQKSSGRIQLDITNGAGLINYTFEVYVDVTGYRADGSLFTESHKLYTEYSNTPMATPTDRSAVVFDGVHQMDVKVTKVMVNGNQVNSNTYFSALELSAIISVERSYKLGTETINGLNAKVENSFVNVAWDSISGAEEYDLEWTFVNSMYNNAKPGEELVVGYREDSQVNYNFIGNATRVRVSGTSYKLPALFEGGYLLFRLRPVSYKKIGKIGVVTGNWTGNPSGIVSNHSARIAFKLNTSVAPHENGLNWIHEANFAEEGKRKDLVTYADGLDKPHQMVTYLPSQKESILKETVYDEFGRTIIETLPTPTGINELKFFRGFYLDNTKKPLSYSYFTGTSEASCSSAGNPLKTANDTSYYEARNGLNNIDKFVPNAGGFPYTQVEYTPDRTGRASIKTMPGDTFRLGGGHESKIFYGQPTQPELDRLFGNDAGDYSHYKKTLQLDQNGQKSVTYTDMQGKTVATALVGASPSSLSPIASNPSLNPAVIPTPLLNNVIHDYSLETVKMFADDAIGAGFKL